MASRTSPGCCQNCTGWRWNALRQGGVRYHGVAEEGVTFRDIADVIGKELNIPVVSKSPEQAAEHFSWFAHFAGMDCAASSLKTREMLDWHPAQPALLEDLRKADYFKV